MSNAKQTRESELRRELAAVLNRYSLENGCNTPDFLLAEYLLGVLAAFDVAVSARDKWYGVELCPCGPDPESKAEAGAPQRDH